MLTELPVYLLVAYWYSCCAPCPVLDMLPDSTRRKSILLLKFNLFLDHSCPKLTQYILRLFLIHGTSNGDTIDY